MPALRRQQRCSEVGRPVLGRIGFDERARSLGEILVVDALPLDRALLDDAAQKAIDLRQSADSGKRRRTFDQSTSVVTTTRHPPDLMNVKHVRVRMQNEWPAGTSGVLVTVIVDIAWPSQLGVPQGADAVETAARLLARQPSQRTFSAS